MSSTAEKILHEASVLDDDERVEVAYSLLRSIDPEKQSAVDAAWREELIQRAAVIDAGKMQGRPASEVFAELRARFA